MTVQLLRRKFTVAQYHHMAEAGIFAPEERVELICGEIVEMSPIGVCHASCVDRLNRVFNRRYPETVIVRVQNPIHLGDRLSEPQPDIALVEARADFYAAAHPQPEDIFLVVEVADASLDYDRTVKALLYAEAGIVEFWIANLIQDCLEVYRQPTPTGYCEMQELQRGDRCNPTALDSLALTVDELLG